MEILFRLRRTVGRGYNNHPADILRVKNVLTGLGLYNVARHGLRPSVNEEMFSAIENYQRLRGLRVDGVIRPGGKTERDIESTIDVTAKSPIIRCPKCGAPHGGVFGKLCPDCATKENS